MTFSYSVAGTASTPEMKGIPPCFSHPVSTSSFFVRVRLHPRYVEFCVHLFVHRFASVCSFILQLADLCYSLRGILSFNRGFEKRHAFWNQATSDIPMKYYTPVFCQFSDFHDRFEPLTTKLPCFLRRRLSPRFSFIVSIDA